MQNNFNTRDQLLRANLAKVDWSILSPIQNDHHERLHREARERLERWERLEAISQRLTTEFRPSMRPEWMNEFLDRIAK